VVEPPEGLVTHEQARGKLATRAAPRVYGGNGSCAQGPRRSEAKRRPRWPGRRRPRRARAPSTPQPQAEASCARPVDLCSVPPRTLSRTLMRAKQGPFWKVRAMPSDGITACGRRRRSPPVKRMLTSWVIRRMCIEERGCCRRRSGRSNRDLGARLMSNETRSQRRHAAEAHAHLAHMQERTAPRPMRPRSPLACRVQALSPPPRAALQA